MPQHNKSEPDWLNGEANRADKLHKSGQGVNNPSARKPKAANNEEKPPRSLKGFRLRNDYQQRFDELAAREKHQSGLKGPDLIEEALELLFRKYDKKLAS